jgi:hypothetical protein
LKKQETGLFSSGFDGTRGNEPEKFFTAYFPGLARSTGSAKSVFSTDRPTFAEKFA